MDLSPLILTFKLAAITTSLLLIVGIPLSYWLAFSKFRLKFLFEALVSMPLVLPPSVLGFYLLVVFSPQNFIGDFLDKYFSLRLVFSFEGLILSSFIFSLPFMVHPIIAGFKSIPTNIQEAAYTLGKSKFTTLKKVLLPNIKPALLSGIVLSFAHTVGEFGVVLMIGGNIPNQTRVASIAIYDEVEALNYNTANKYAFILLLISFAILIIMHYYNKKMIKLI